MTDQFYVMTDGSYDGYAIAGLFRGPPGLNIRELAKQWAAENPELAADRYRGVYIRNASSFRKFLIERAGLTEVDYQEVWDPGSDLGRYIDS